MKGGPGVGGQGMGENATRPAMRSHTDVARARRMLAEALPGLDPTKHARALTRTETALDILGWVLGEHTGFAGAFLTMCANEDRVLGRPLQQGPGDGGQEPVPASHELCEAMLKRPLTRAECVTAIAALQGLPREDLSPPELAILAAAEAEA